MEHVKDWYDPKEVKQVQILNVKCCAEAEQSNKVLTHALVPQFAELPTTGQTHGRQSFQHILDSHLAWRKRKGGILYSAPTRRKSENRTLFFRRSSNQKMTISAKGIACLVKQRHCPELRLEMVYIDSRHCL